MKREAALALQLESAIERAGGITGGRRVRSRSTWLDRRRFGRSAEHRWSFGGGDHWRNLPRAGTRRASVAGLVVCMQLYGPYRRAPYASLAAMGGAFVVARSGHHVVDVTAEAIQVRSPNGAELQIYRRELGAESVLAWSLCGVEALASEKSDSRHPAPQPMDAPTMRCLGSTL